MEIAKKLNIDFHLITVSLTEQTLVVTEKNKTLVKQESFSLLAEHSIVAI